MHIDATTNTIYVNAEDDRPFAETGGVAIVDLDADLNRACVSVVTEVGVWILV